MEYVKKKKKVKYRLYADKLKICSYLDYYLLNRIKTIECVMYTQLYCIFLFNIIKRHSKVRLDWSFSSLIRLICKKWDIR